jgi:hypothetical protein
LKKVIIIIIIIAVVIGTFYYLRYYFEKEDVELWDLVPKNSLAVYEIENPEDIWSEFQEMPVWENLSTIPEISKVNATLTRIDTLDSGRKNLDLLLSDENFLISFHKISNNNLDVIFYLPINSTEKRKKLSEILMYYSKLPGNGYSTRNYQHMNIHEVNFSETGKSFSYLEYKNFFVGSFTPFLIDDVIRNISSGFIANFRSEVSEIFQQKPIETDQGNIYVDLTRIPDLIGVMVAPSSEKKYDGFLKWLAEASYYDISFEGNQIFLNGSSSVPMNQDEYFSGFLF